MERTVIVNGRVTDDRHIELDEPVTGLRGAVQVVLRHRTPPPAKQAESVFDVIARLAGGTRSKENIDRQVREERESWGDR